MKLLLLIWTVRSFDAAEFVLEKASFCTCNDRSCVIIPCSVKKCKEQRCIPQLADLFMTNVRFTVTRLDSHSESCQRCDITIVYAKKEKKAFWAEFGQRHETLTFPSPLCRNRSCCCLAKLLHSGPLKLGSFACHELTPLERPLWRGFFFSCVRPARKSSPSHSSCSTYST